MARTGTVIRWEERAGWGFVQDNESLISYFLHNHELVDGTRGLRPGDKVLFELGRTKSHRTQAGSRPPS